MWCVISMLTTQSLWPEMILPLFMAYDSRSLITTTMWP